MPLEKNTIDDEPTFSTNGLNSEQSWIFADFFPQRIRPEGSKDFVPGSTGTSIWMRFTYLRCGEEISCWRAVVDGIPSGK